MSFVVAVDVGGTSIKAARVSATGVGTCRASASSPAADTRAALIDVPPTSTATTKDIYLIDPAVRPPTTFPSMKANSTITGIVATTQPAKTCPQSIEYWPM